MFKLEACSSTGVLTMSKKSLLLWVVLLLVFVVFKASASDANDSEAEDDYGSNGSSDNEGTHMDDNGEEENAQRQDEGINFSENVDPELIFSNIIGGGFEIIPKELFIFLTPEHISRILSDPLGARLAAAHPLEIFTTDNNAFLEFAAIHEEFFENLSLFNISESTQDFSIIPSEILAKAIDVQSANKMLNLKGLIDKFENLNCDLCYDTNFIKTFGLAHLFDFESLQNPLYYLGRGISYDPQHSLKDKTIWDISLQLFLYRLLNEENYKKKGDYDDILILVKAQISESRLKESQNELFKLNYFGLADSDNFDIQTTFNLPKLLTLNELSVTIEQLSEVLGFTDIFKTDYIQLTIEERIVYRLIVYVVISNPLSISEQERNDLVLNLIKNAPKTDFTDAEIEFLVKRCINHHLGDAIASIFSDTNSSTFKAAFSAKMIQTPENYSNVVNSISNEIKRLPFLKRSAAIFSSRINLKNEEFYHEKQLKRQQKITAMEISSSSANAGSDDIDLITTGGRKRLRNGESAPESQIISSHFLSSEQLKSFKPLDKPSDNKPKEFVVPYPDREYFNNRYDNLMQNLDSTDFGEANWKIKYLNLDQKELKNAWDEHEKILNEFVRLVFQAVDYMKNNPRAPVEIVFRGSPSFGDGPKLEALEMFARAILLPNFKVFYYNSSINGFVPYPLLDENIMETLGYLNAWFVEKDIPLSWNLSEAYMKFLFYEEDSTESMQSIIETFYGGIFKNIDALNDPDINPLEFFPTTFYTHRPLALSDKNINQIEVLDLFTPNDSSENPLYNSLVNFLDEESINLLSGEEMMIEESKDETELLESKEDDKFISRSDTQKTYFNARENFIANQMQLKRDITQIMKSCASHEIIEHLLLGRFAFMRQFLKIFNTLAQDHITSNLYESFQNAQAAVITAKDLIDGIVFVDEENTEIRIKDQFGKLYSPRQTLNHILETLPPEMMKTFYWFCTGCLSLPLGGLKKFPIAVSIWTGTGLSTARTCFRKLFFHFNKDESVEYHVEDLRKALSQCSGFHVEEGRTDTADAVVGVFVDVPIAENAETVAENTETVEIRDTNDNHQIEEQEQDQDDLSLIDFI